MGNHYWYLCGPVVLFALFSNLVSDEEKYNMAQKLLSFDKPTGIKFGKPQFPEEVGVDTVLSDLVTAESWRFFDCSKTDPGFLSRPVAEWKTDDQYLEAEKFVKTLKCTNDVAERGNMIIRMMMMMMMIIQYCTLAGVKLTTEYMQVLTKDSRMRQKICEVVEWDRRNNAGVDKTTLNK